MKNVHGLAREIMIDEILNKMELLERAGSEWGLEDESTVELYKMKDNGASYTDMLAFYHLVNEAMAEDWGFDF